MSSEYRLFIRATKVALLFCNLCNMCVDTPMAILGECKSGMAGIPGLTAAWWAHAGGTSRTCHWWPGPHRWSRPGSWAWCYAARPLTAGCSAGSAWCRRSRSRSGPPAPGTHRPAHPPRPSRLATPAQHRREVSARRWRCCCKRFEPLCSSPLCQRCLGHRNQVATMQEVSSKVRFVKSETVDAPVKNRPWCQTEAQYNWRSWQNPPQSQIIDTTEEQGMHRSVKVDQEHSWASEGTGGLPGAAAAQSLARGKSSACTWRTGLRRHRSARPQPAWPPQARWHAGCWTQTTGPPWSGLRTAAPSSWSSPVRPASGWWLAAPHTTSPAPG